MTRCTVETPELCPQAIRAASCEQRVGAPRGFDRLVDGERHDKEQEHEGADPRPAPRLPNDDRILAKILAHAPLPQEDGGSVGPVRTPRAGPSTTDDVSTITWPFSIEIGNRSIPRGAGPDRYSPITLYWLP